MKRRNFLLSLLAAPMVGLPARKTPAKPEIQTFEASGTWTKPPLGSIETVTVGHGGWGSAACPYNNGRPCRQSGSGGGTRCECGRMGGGGGAA